MYSYKYVLECMFLAMAKQEDQVLVYTGDLISVLDGLDIKFLAHLSTFVFSSQH